jgi:hypothetical protein
VRTIITPLILVFLGGYTSLGVSADEGESAENVSEAFSKAKIKGQLRYSAQYRDSNLNVLQDSSTPNVSDKKTQQYSALGGYLGFETAPLMNTSVGATFYTSNPVGKNPDDRRGLGGLYEKDGGQDAYNVLGEAYLKYQSGNHLAAIGRHELPDYRFVSPSNIRMTPVTHQGAVYENTSFEGLKLNFAYLDRQKERNAEEFIGMVRAARVSTGCGAVDGNGDCVEAGGKQLIRGDFDPADYDEFGAYSGDRKEMSMVGAVYSGASYSVEVWDYYVDDFQNMIYFYGDYILAPENSGYTYVFAAQYADQIDVGGAVAGNIDTWFYGFKFALNGPGLSFFAAYNEVEYNEDSFDGGTVFVRWGTPQMFNSFQVQDSELAGVRSAGVGFQYDFGRQGILPGVVMRIRYGDYDMPDKLSQSDARQDRSEATFDLRYSFTRDSGFGIFTEMDGLSVQFRLAYNDYDTSYDFEAYQRIHSYEFESVTDDFIDARIYVDYMF